ncbi:MAG: hypothetical protein ABI823_09000, partial [Bryobacteraceae bacterium]
MVVSGYPALTVIDVPVVLRGSLNVMMMELFTGTLVAPFAGMMETNCGDVVSGVLDAAVVKVDENGGSALPD